jgi:hypothetical protein
VFPSHLLTAVALCRSLDISPQLLVAIDPVKAIPGPLVGGVGAEMLQLRMPLALAGRDR